MTLDEDDNLSLLDFEEEFLSLNFTNTKQLKYMKVTDLNKFKIRPSMLQYRVLATAIEKCQSPTTTKILDSLAYPDAGK